MYSPQELYEIAKQDGGRTFLSDLAKQVGTKAPNFMWRVTEYAQANNLPVPKMLLEKSLSSVKYVNRKNPSSDIRISHLRIKNAGLGDVLNFKVVTDVEKSRIYLEPAEKPGMLEPETVRAVVRRQRKTKQVVQEFPWDNSSVQVKRKPGRPRKYPVAQ